MKSYQPGDDDTIVAVPLPMRPNRKSRRRDWARTRKAHAQFRRARSIVVSFYGDFLPHSELYLPRVQFLRSRRLLSDEQARILRACAPDNQ